MAYLRFAALPLVLAASVCAGVALALAPAGLRAGVRLRLASLLCKLGCRVLGLRVRTLGPIPLERPAMLISNHISWTDVLAFGSVAPVCFVARHDLADWPILGLLSRLFGTIFVERRRLRQIPQVNAEMAARMAAGDLVALFPEATTGDGTRLKPFHAVHLAAARDLLRERPEQNRVLIAPAAIVYGRRRGLPLGRNGRSEVAWYGDSDFVPHLVDLIRDGGAECTISFRPTFEFRSGDDRKAATRRARATISGEFSRLVCGVPSETPRPYVQSSLQGV
ncbi:MAG: 1-acyl-sn-glycerol-3-phosphate acyltransferase [Hyphomicrobiales bacterium]|nr:1-acyl-sn-glycerol-3-phosphate acyltransferase [Hyphomicrobiales bacterium]